MFDYYCRGTEAWSKTEMSDRELLEMAAAAAGYTLKRLLRFQWQMVAMCAMS